MQISDTGLALTKSFEGLRLTAYRDSGGVLTIGYGHTGPDVHPGQTITEGEAESLLRADMAHAERFVSEVVKVAVKQSQFDALVDFAFNVGVGSLESSTLIRMVNAADFTGAVRQFGLWVHDGGQVVPGLVRRRMAEAAMFQEAA